MDPAFVLRDVTFAYPEAEVPALTAVSLEVAEGTFCLVTGATGSGKSTFLRAINGLVPHFTGGTFEGSVSVGGRDTRDHPPRRLSDLVAFLPQDPGASFVMDRVDEELAYALENLAVPPDRMTERVDRVAELLDIGDLLSRSVRELSGGERQRVAIAAALTPGARVVVLDEPTSQLDPDSAEEVLGALDGLVRQHGFTVVMAEHRLERVVGFADTAIGCADGHLFIGAVAEVLSQLRLGPPVTCLGRALGWSPLPLTIDAAKQRASEVDLAGPPAPVEGDLGDPVLVARDLTVAYGDRTVFEDLSFGLRSGEICALTGPNGAGKTTLLRALCSVETPRSGDVLFNGRAPKTGRDVALCPQASDDLLFTDSVLEEIQATLVRRSDPPTAADLLEGWRLAGCAHRHPRDLSAGERLLVALAAVAATGAPVLLLDEPTRGLDGPTKTHLIRMLRLWAAQGCAVLVATHDVELIASVAHRVTRVENGRVVADGAPRDVLAGGHDGPQMTQLFGPGWLTTEQVLDALTSAVPS